jgi:hypothetical protein
VSIGENPAEIASEKEFLDENSASRGIFDCVRHQGSAIKFSERVFVYPNSIRSPNLPVNKTMRRLPDTDFALPMQGDSVHAKTVIDQHTGFLLQRHWSQDFKMQPSGSEVLKVPGIGKE